MGELAALLAAFTWSCTSVAMASMAKRTTPVAMSTLRLGIASLLLPFVLLASGEVGDFRDATASSIVAMVGSGILASTVGDTIYIATLARIGVQRAFTLTMTLFISLTVVGGIVLLGESMHWYQFLGAAAVAVGVSLIVRTRKLPGGAEKATDWVGYALVGLVAIVWAAATLWLAGQRGNLGSIAASSVRTPAAAVGMLAFALATAPRDLVLPFQRPAHIASIVAIGVASSLFGSLLYVYAVGEAGAGRTTILSAASPMMALPLSVYFLKEPFTRLVAIGTAVCVGGVVLVVF